MNPVAAALAIRRYLPSDGDAVWRLNAAALEALGKRPSGPIIEMLDRELRDIDRAYISGGGEFLVGLLDQQIIAMGALKRLNQTAAEVTKMRVAPAHWRRGYGEALLLALEDRAREMGIRELWLDTSPRQTVAQQLYLKHGYDEYRRCLLEGMELILYCKKLADRGSES